MDAKKFLLGTLIGGIAFFILGYLIWGVAFVGFFEANPGTAVNAAKEVPDWPWLIVGQLGTAAIFTYVFGRWAHIRTFVGGMKGGFVLGLLIAIGVDFTQLGTMNILTPMTALVDSILFGVDAAIGGGVIGAVLGMGKDEAV